MSGPTARGRFVAISLGIVGGSLATGYLLKDFQLVRRLDDPSVPPDNKPFRVRFEKSEPLRLKPEAQERLARQMRERQEREQRQREQQEREQEREQQER